MGVQPLAIAAILYAVTFLARSGDIVFVNAGDGIRVARDCRCERLRAGTSATIVLGEDGAIVELRRSKSGENTQAALPASAIVADVRSRRTASTAAAAARTVAVTIIVTVPNDTPQSDDLFLSTDRSGWNAGELRMDRIDALHWKVGVNLAEGATLLYRFSRGSFVTLERDRANVLPPPRKLTASDGLVVRDEIARFGDRN